MPEKSARIDPLKLYYMEEYYQAGDKGYVPPMPKILLMQASSVCNFACRQCYRRVLVPRRRESGLGNGHMSPDLVRKIASEVKEQPGVVGAHFALYGEPLVNPRLADMVRVLKQAGIKVQVVTNGFLLNRKMASALMDAGLDKIKISFQGATPEKYAFWRNNAHHGRIVDNIEQLVALRDSRASDLYIQVGTSSADDTEEELARFVEFWMARVDHAYWNYTILTHIREEADIKERDIVREAPLNTERCVDPFVRMSVLWNGLVAQCVEDEEHFVGDLRQETLAQVWNGPAMAANRAALLAKGNCLPNCFRCGMQPASTRAYAYRYGQDGEGDQA